MFTPEEQIFVDTILEQLQSPNPKIAFHSPCPDGMTSAALYLHLHPSQTFTLLPLDYWILKVPKYRSILVKQAYHAILDLEPFNDTHVLDLYVDHHRSTIGKPIYARQILFDASGESAAAVYYDHLKQAIPEALEELVELTRITDTASFTVDAPLQSIPVNTEKALEWYYHASQQEKAWLLEDLARSIYSYDEISRAIHALKENGLKGILSIEFITPINETRYLRQDSLEQSKAVNPSDMMVLIFSPKTYDHKAIMADLMKRGAKVIASLTQDADGGFRLSLRLSKLVQKKESPENYRLDLLAKQFNGGGHPAAAGGKITDYTSGLEALKSYAKDHSLEFKVIDFRQSSPKETNP